MQVEKRSKLSQVLHTLTGVYPRKCYDPEGKHRNNSYVTGLPKHTLLLLNNSWIHIMVNMALFFTCSFNTTLSPQKCKLNCLQCYWTISLPAIIIYTYGVIGETSGDIPTVL